MVFRFYSPDKLRASIPETHFVSYGNQRFKESRDRIQRQAEALGLFESVTVYTEADRDRWFEDAPAACKSISKLSRGGGYWLWKSFSILTKLREIGDGACVVYADSGCSVYHTRRGAELLCRFVNETCAHRSGAMICRELHRERPWTKGDVFAAILPEAAEDEGMQLNSGRMIFVKRESVVAQIEQVASYAWEQPNLFDDSPSRVANAPEFIDNRHDQSVFSLTAKRHGYLVKGYRDMDPAIRMTRLRR